GNALAEIAALPTEERVEAINRKHRIWAELKPYLALLSHEKCWYCESIQESSDMHVDHFRPEGRIADEGSHGPGYWWLAFDWHNFRLSCTYCNTLRSEGDRAPSGGKADRFPLWEEARRCLDR